MASGILVALLAVVASVLWSQGDCQASQNEFVRACYFTNWSPYRAGKGQYSPLFYQPGLCTHMIYAFATFSTADESFKVVNSDPIDLPSDDGKKGLYQQVFDLKITDPKLKTILALGGYNFGNKPFSLMSRTSSGRGRFIQSLVFFARHHGFDGVSLDWSYPESDDDRQNFALLLRELRVAVSAEALSNTRAALLITAAVSASDYRIRQAYDIPAMNSYVDYVWMMSMDYAGHWQSMTGIHGALFAAVNHPDKDYQNIWSTEYSARRWARGGMAKEKLIVGVAAYGRGWTLEDNYQRASRNNNLLYLPAKGPSNALQYTRAKGMAAYFELCSLLKSPSVHERFAQRQVGAYFKHRDQWFSYDNTVSMRIKMSWIKQQRYGGVFVWALDTDDFGNLCGNGKYPLLTTIRSELSNGATVNRGKNNF